MSSHVVSSVVDVANTLPTLDESMIQRPHYLDTIADIFDSDVPVVFVEGKDGRGKSTLAAQFAYLNPTNTVSIFVEPTSRWSYDPRTVLIELCNQYTFLLDGRELDDLTSCDESQLNALSYRIIRYARRSSKRINFVVDGLMDVCNTDASIAESVLGLLPIGKKHFRFLITGDANELKRHLRSSAAVPSKSFWIPDVGLEEAQRFLSAVVSESDTIKKIHLFARGSFSLIACIRRVLAEGNLTAGEILNSGSPELDDILDLEWSRIGVTDAPEAVLLAVALLSIDSRPRTIGDLADTVGIEKAELCSHLSQYPILQIDSSETVSFVAKYSREFARRKLSELEKAALELQIASYSSDPGSEVSLTYLPDYLERAGLRDKVLEYLSPETIEQIVFASRNLYQARSKTALGLANAVSLQNDRKIIQFAAQQSAIAGVTGVSATAAQIRALMALDKYETALELANKSLLVERRLELLCTIARAKREKGLEPEQSLVELIKDCVGVIDPKALGTKALEIATDLVFVDFELAMDLVEKSYDSKDGENSLDLALGTVAFLSVTKESESDQGASLVSDINSRIKNPEIRNLLSASAAVVQQSDVDQVIAAASAVEKASERLFILRTWIKTNVNDPHATKAVSCALDILIGATEYSPNATVLSELAIPLKCTASKEEAKELVSRFAGIMALAERSGPTLDYVRLQLHLAEAELLYDAAACYGRVVDVYYYVHEISDKGLQLAALGWMQLSLLTLDRDGGLEAEEGIDSLVRDLVDSVTADLLANTADHLEVFEPYLLPLSKLSPSSARELACKLNTRDRREISQLLILDAMLVPDRREAQIDAIIEQLSVFSRESLRAEAVIRSLRYLADMRDGCDKIAGFEVRLLGIVMEIGENIARSEALQLLFQILGACILPEAKRIRDEIVKALTESVSAIDSQLGRITRGFAAASALAEVNPGLAQEMYLSAEAEKAECSFDSDDTLTSYIGCVKLSIRAVGGLIASKAHCREDLEKLISAITEVPSPADQAELFCELAVRCYYGGDQDFCREIVAKFLRRLIDEAGSSISRFLLISDVAPALYCANKFLGFKEILQVPTDFRDDALSAVLHVIMSGVPHTEPYQKNRQDVYRITYEVAEEAVNLLREVERDSAFVGLMRRLVRSAEHTSNGLTREQKASLNTSLEAIVKQKLPNDDFIRHEGYCIVADSLLLHLMGNRISDKWNDLLVRTREIGNASDRVFIYSAIIQVVPGRLREIGEKAFEQALADLENVGSVADQVGRLEDLAESAKQLNDDRCERCLRSALELLTRNADNKGSRAMRQLIDRVYQLDPNLASTLISKSDDDPARREARRLLDEKRQIAEIEDAISRPTHSGRLYEMNRAIDYAKACWKLLGALNAGKLRHLPIDETRELLRLAAGLPIKDSYPIFAFVIQNACIRFATTPHVGRSIRPLFDMMSYSAKLMRNISSSRWARSSATHVPTTKGAVKNAILIGAGDATTGRSAVVEWVEKNVQSCLLICDPYFGRKELAWIREFFDGGLNSPVKVLTSRIHQRDELGTGNWQDAWENEWDLIAGGADYPSVEVTIAGTAKEGRLPIHDRWLLSISTGIRLGCSLNSLGVSKATELKEMNESEVNQCRIEVDRFLDRNKRSVTGEKMTYSVIVL